MLGGGQPFNAGVAFVAFARRVLTPRSGDVVNPASLSAKDVILISGEGLVSGGIKKLDICVDSPWTTFYYAFVAGRGVRRRECWTTTAKTNTGCLHLC